MVKINENNIPLIKIEEPAFEKKGIELYVLREDLIHPEISGNKWRKLKYNLKEAREKGYTQILTYGGCYSNHIAATAAAGRDFGLKTIGIIRGDEILPYNPTLEHAHKNGMEFKFISREQYRGNNKYEKQFLDELNVEFSKFYLLPEGGSNVLAVKGCVEIIKNINTEFDAICCACGTGGTISGIIASVDETKKVMGFPALKGGEFLKKDILRLLVDYSNSLTVIIKNNNWELNTNYHFGGFAKISTELVNFITEFKEKHNILLDLIYTRKMMYGLYDLIKNTEQLNNKKIIAVHTGGIQGNKGFEERFNITI